MSRKDLEKFNPAKLKPGRTFRTAVVDPATGHLQVHYFYRDRDGELFSCITNRYDTGTAERKAWQKLKRAKAKDLKQLNFAQLKNGGGNWLI